MLSFYSVDYHAPKVELASSECPSISLLSSFSRCMWRRSTLLFTQEFSSFYAPLSPMTNTDSCLAFIVPYIFHIRHWPGFFVPHPSAFIWTLLLLFVLLFFWDADIRGCLPQSIQRASSPLQHILSFSNGTSCSFDTQHLPMQIFVSTWIFAWVESYWHCAMPSSPWCRSYSHSYAEYHSNAIMTLTKLSLGVDMHRGISATYWVGPLRCLQSDIQCACAEFSLLSWFLDFAFLISIHILFGDHTSCTFCGLDRYSGAFFAIILLAFMPLLCFAETPLMTFGLLTKGLQCYCLSITTPEVYFFPQTTARQ